MSSFDVHAKNLSLNQPYILEASAGTGKTYSIQHLFVRLLLEKREKEKIALEEILVVTFTRAAAQELQERISSHLRNVIHLLSSGNTETLPYLHKIENKQRVERELSLALLNFENAYICTIHGFCARLLAQYDPSTTTQPVVETISQEEVKEIIKDVIRTELSPSLFHPIQVELLFKAQSIEEISLQVEHLLQKELPFKQYSEYEKWGDACSTIWTTLYNKYHPSSQQVWEYFEKRAPCYKKIKNRILIWNKHVMK